MLQKEPLQWPGKGRTTPATRIPSSARPTPSTWPTTRSSSPLWPLSSLFWLLQGQYFFRSLFYSMLYKEQWNLRCVWFRLRQTVASILLHQRMFEAVVNTSIHFFDMNPIGRILNRFSKDVGTMDDQLSFVFFEFLMVSLIFQVLAILFD